MCGRVAHRLAVGVNTLQHGLHFIPNVSVITFVTVLSSFLFYSAIILTLVCKIIHSTCTLFSCVYIF
jgi:hypothetical protein